jgi:2-(1,2-epoxy-1,2-dihydrophenyl)acetyl-CoA isomerase
MAGRALAMDNGQQLAQDLYQALGAWDRTRLGELLHRDFEGHATEGLPLGLGGTYHGPEAMCRDFWARIGQAFAGARAIPAGYAPLPDGRLMVTGRYQGTARKTGTALDAEFVHILSFSGGQISRLDQLTDSAQWVLALAPPLARAAGQEADEEDARPAGSRPRTVTFRLADGGLGILQLSRPAARNAIDADFVADLAAAVQQCAAEAALRALLIRADGPAFTVGGDVTMLAATSPGDLPATLRQLTTSYHSALRILDGLAVPVVAAVQGAVAGGGFGLMHVADIVLAAEGTRFATGFAALGLSGDGGSTWFLPRLIGTRRAAELYLEQRVLDAAEALDWGLISRVIPAAELAAEAERTASRLAAGPTRALGEIRALLRRSPQASLGDQLLAETEALSRTAATRDAAHGLASFIARTSPDFRGW